MQPNFRGLQLVVLRGSELKSISKLLLELAVALGGQLISRLLIDEG
jgi:hypothetical protein